MRNISLSKGVKSPNQIPLELAMDLEVLDYDTLRSDLNDILSTIESDRNDSSAILFNQIVLNKTKALNSLSSNMKWNQSAEEFIKFVGTDPIDKGFKATVYQYSQEKMSLIYQYLNDLFIKNRV